jgi:hypothetical protein
MRNARGNVPAPLLIYKGGKAKCIPPSTVGNFFMVRLPERRRKLMTEPGVNL